MCRFRILRAASAVVLVLAACTALKHGWTLSSYEGQVLEVHSGKGADRLKIETEFDPTIAHWVGQHGEPDYIHVQSGSLVELCYIAEDRVVTFTRGWTENSTASVSEPIPQRLHQMFIQADRQHLDALRGTPGREPPREPEPDSER
jgi:hypothetical protein